jgi:hypothetical protein
LIKLQTSAFEKILPKKAIIFIISSVLVGNVLILLSLAATPTTSLEAESSTVTAGATKISDTSASGGSAVIFNASQGSAWWKPPKNTRWQWILEAGILATDSSRFDMYDIDLTDAMPADTLQEVTWQNGFKATVKWPKGSNAGIIAKLKSQGKKVICYMDTGAFETYEPDAVLIPGKYGTNNANREMAYLGPSEYASWDVIGGLSSASDGSTFAGEYWMDIRQTAWPAILPVVQGRLDLAKKIGCDGVEGDQNNVYGNDSTFGVTQAISLRWFREIYYQTHTRNLTVISKNGIELTSQQVTDPINISYCTPGLCVPDGILNEECAQYSECELLDIATSKNIWVGQVEYRGAISTVCPDAKAKGRMTMKKPENYSVTENIIFACWEN